MVDLKAELYKKQQEVKATSKGSYKDNTTQRHVSEKVLIFEMNVSACSPLTCVSLQTASIWLGPNKTTKGRRQKPAPPSLEPDSLEEEVLTRSRYQSSCSRAHLSSFVVLVWSSVRTLGWIVSERELTKTLLNFIMLELTFPMLPQCPREFD